MASYCTADREGNTRVAVSLINWLSLTESSLSEGSMLFLMEIQIKLRAFLSCYCSVNSIEWSHMICHTCLWVAFLSSIDKTTSVFPWRNNSGAYHCRPLHWLSTCLFWHNNDRIQKQIKFVILFLLLHCVGLVHFSKEGNFLVIVLCSNSVLELQSHRWQDGSCLWK